MSVASSGGPGAGLDGARVDPGLEGVPVGPGRWWFVDRCWLGELCVAMLLRVRSPDPGEARVDPAREDLRAIARATAALLAEEEIHLPLVCFLSAENAGDRSLLARWVLDASWHDGEAAFLLAPRDEKRLERVVRGLLFPSVRHVEGVQRLDDARFREEWKAILDRQVETLKREDHLHRQVEKPEREDEGAADDLRRLRAELEARGAFDSTGMKDVLVQWIHELEEQG